MNRSVGLHLVYVDLQHNECIELAHRRSNLSLHLQFHVLLNNLAAEL